METVLITGASSGIGLSFAHLFASKGHDLVIAARDSKNLSKLKKELTETYGVIVHAITIDLSVPDSSKQLYDAAKQFDIEILINNAGAGLKGDFFGNDLTQQTKIAQLNMISVMELCHLFGNDFIEKGTGKILNLGSIVAFLAGPNQPVYYATKNFIRSLTRALHYVAKPKGVTVTALHPGITKTHFFDAAGASNITSGASPDAVALTGYKALMRGRVEVTHGITNILLVTLFVRLLPSRIQTAIIARISEV